VSYSMLHLSGVDDLLLYQSSWPLRVHGTFFGKSGDFVDCFKMILHFT
jgi:hypothetical protein